MNSKSLKIFNASAGSGKTYTLVREYLRIILHDPDPKKMGFRKILAMTFTNKAANEMKERILSKLIELSKPAQERSVADIKELQLLAKELDISEDQLVTRSAACLNAILHHYGMFSVMTIDKFTHKVIRTFSKDLGLSVDFDVELDLETLRKHVADLLFDRIGRDEEITQLMLSYVDNNLNQDRSWNFKKQLVEFSKQLFQEDALKAIKQLSELSAKDFAAAKDKIIAERSSFENKLQGMAKEAVDLIKSKGLEHDDFKSKSSGVYAYFIRVAEGRTDLRASDTLLKLAKEDDWVHPKSTNRTTAVEIAPLLTQYFYQIEEIFEKELGRYHLSLELLRIINNLSLMNHLLQITEELKEEDNIVLISDFYKKISEIIANEPVPFIYERLGVRYEHFLLDEFQDTSHMQWVNLIPLLHNSLAQKHSNLIVGDGKQAIYRWRNGEVEQFISLPNSIHNPQNIESLKEAAVTFKNEGDLIPLTSNYRSAGEIVQFNNRFFEALTKDMDEYIQRIYASGKQEVKKSFSGYLEFNFPEDKEDLSQQKYVLEVVNRCLEKGYRMSDICVLSRTNKIGSRIATYLTASGVKVISQESLFVSKDLTVRFLFNLIAALAHPHAGNYSKKAVEYYDLIYRKTQPQQLIEFGDVKKIDVKKWLEKMGYNLHSSDHFHSFYEYVEHLIEVFDIELGENAYLQSFLEQIHLFEKRHSTNVHGFIDWFNEKGKKESIQSPEGAEAVNVMTIHKAKGLQFPVVICAHFDWDQSNNRSEKWIVDSTEHIPAFYLKSTKATKLTQHKTLMEEEDMKTILDNLNLVYVAFTRAERALFVCGHVDSKSKNLAVEWVKPHLEQLLLNEEAIQEHNIFKIGKFESSVASTETGNNNYRLEFLKQKMGKPQLSFKNAEQWDIHDIDRKRLYGTQLHFLLSIIKSQGDIDQQIEKLLRKGKIDPVFTDRMRSDLSRLFENDHFSALFDEQLHVLNEKEIIDREGRKHIPDKIIFEDGKVRVVDFKTGREQPKKYQKQLREYLLLLRDQGYTDVSGELFYTEDGTVSKVLIE
ncbi:MAG: UvrD-helicase domain-containing protein [Crocinitomicaceae bacterium]